MPELIQRDVAAKKIIRSSTFGDIVITPNDPGSDLMARREK
jgi:hypothetical protein